MKKKDIRLIDLRSVKKLLHWWASTTYEALRYTDYCGDFDDLLQDGMVTFLESLNIYDPEKGCKFNSFLYIRLMQLRSRKKKQIKVRRSKLDKIMDVCSYMFADENGEGLKNIENSSEIFGEINI